MIAAIDKKLLRDLSRLRGQVITIALVVAGGIAGYVTMQGTYRSLEYSKTTYYERYRFGDMFAHAKRVPDLVAARIGALEGVASVYTRVVENVTIPIDTLTEPASGTVISIPEGRHPPMNDVYLRAGRMLEPGRTDEILLLESFATEHGIEPGDTVPVVINGTLRDLRVAGVAMTPEYVFPMPVGGISADAKRFAVLWMNREAVAAAFEMSGAFNDVVLKLQPGASEASIIDGLDRILAPYGGFGAVGRSKQPSNNVLNAELEQLKTFATVIPFIFLGVAAFLLNVVLARLVRLQREQIAALKALGYPGSAIGLHYVKLVSVIVLIGAVLGIAGGWYFGRGMIDLYRPYFRLPNLAYRPDASVAFIAVGVSLLSAVIGALASARSVARLPPAEAMRPPAPANFKPTVLERLGFHKLLSPASRMILREIERRPFRLALSSVGIAMAVGIVVVGRFQADAMDHMMRVQFHEAWAEDVAVSFLTPLDERAVRDIAHIPGVLHAEGSRVVPVRFRAGPRFRDSIVMGYQDDGVLRRPLDGLGHQVELPPEGIVVSRKLAELLDVSPGEQLTVEIREGDRETKQILLVRTIDDSFGLYGYMRQTALEAFLGEDRVVSQAFMRIDPMHLADIEDRLKETPMVQSVLRKQTIIDQFNDQSAEMMTVMTLIMTLFASVIAVGVVYNNARVALSMRARDLGSLRVLGFKRSEISAILMGELAIQVLLAIPLGLFIGNAMAHGIMASVDPEQYRLPVIISARTYAYATVVTLAAGIASALLVRRKLDKLDLIAVLKTRE